MKTYLFKTYKGKRETRGENEVVTVVARNEEEASNRLLTAIWPRRAKLLSESDEVHRYEVHFSRTIDAPRNSYYKKKREVQLL